MTVNAVLATLRHAWLSLESLNKPMAVMGGIALSAWQYVRATQDVDLLVAIEGAQIPALIDHLGRRGFQPKRSPPVLTLNDFQLIQFTYQLPGSHLDLQLDVLTGASDFQRTALGRAIRMKLPDLDLEPAVLTCEDLILFKLLAGRIIDLGDCAGLLKANVATIDRTYLAQWSKRLGLSAEFAEVWKNTLPDETPPVP